MQKIPYRAGVTLLAALLAACTAATNLTTPQQDVSLRVREKSYPTLPASDKISTTSFGNYEFKAQQVGSKPFYGILPLKFNGGFLALDILFFAPAMFFNLRGVFPEYEIDLQRQVIRYRKPGAEWIEYQPTAAEAARARKYFGDGS